MLVDTRRHAVREEGDVASVSDFRRGIFSCHMEFAIGPLLLYALLDFRCNFFLFLQVLFHGFI